jgi:hypothetical protein
MPVEFLSDEQVAARVTQTLELGQHWHHHGLVTERRTERCPMSAGDLHQVTHVAVRQANIRDRCDGSGGKV